MNTSAQLQLTDLLVIPIGLALFVALMFWREIWEKARALVNHYAVVRYVPMSSEVGRDDAEDQPSYQTPVPQPNQRALDTYQANRSTAARTGTKQSDAEWIATLAQAKGDDSKYRFTANAIAALVGGTRKDVLDQIRAIRNLPQYHALSPEQHELRERLGLPQR